jgi:Protein of unknown function (DUF3489)
MGMLGFAWLLTSAPSFLPRHKLACPKKSAPKAKKMAKGKAAKKAASKGKAAANPAGKADAAGKDTKKAQVREMLRKGATLSAIIEATGWQPNTTRGFISILSGPFRDLAKNPG